MASLEVDSDGGAEGDIADADDDEDGADAEAADSGRGRRYPSILLQSNAQRQQLAWCPLVPKSNEMSRSKKQGSILYRG